MNEISERVNFYYQALIKILPRLGVAVLVLIVGILIANWLTDIIRQWRKSKSKDSLMSGFLSKAIKLVFMAIIFLLTLNIAGLSGVAAAILTAGGASAVLIDFAFKDIAENFLAGIILAFNQSFHVNDTVSTNRKRIRQRKSYEVPVYKNINVRQSNMYIPNSYVLTKPIYNYTEDGFFRSDFVVGSAYENDIEMAKELIYNCITSEQDIVHDDQHTNFVVEDELAASTVNLKGNFWVNTDDFRRGRLETRGCLITKIKATLESKGFNLPANIKELKFYNASRSFEVLKPAMNMKEKMYKYDKFQVSMSACY